MLVLAAGSLLAFMRAIVLVGFAVADSRPVSSFCGVGMLIGSLAVGFFNSVVQRRLRVIEVCWLVQGAVVSLPAGLSLVRVTVVWRACVTCG